MKRSTKLKNHCCKIIINITTYINSFASTLFSETDFNTVTDRYDYWAQCVNKC